MEQGSESGEGKAVRRTHLQMIQVISIFVVGAGVGWLTGLSASPVVASVLASLLGVGAGIVTGLKTVKTNEQEGASQLRGEQWIDARPAALLILGVAVGAPFGILARTHQIFVPAHVRQEMRSNVGSPLPPHLQGVLFSVTAEDCAESLALVDHPNGEAFRETLKASGLPGARKLVANVQDTDILRIVVRALCRDE
jgi:hypothetical protein